MQIEIVNLNCWPIHKVWANQWQSRRKVKISNNYRKFPSNCQKEWPSPWSWFNIFLFNNIQSSETARLAVQSLGKPIYRPVHIYNFRYTFFDKVDSTFALTSFNSHFTKNSTNFLLFAGPSQNRLFHVLLSFGKNITGRAYW